MYTRNEHHWDEKEEDFGSEEKKEKSDKRISFELIDYETRSKSVIGKHKRPNSGSFVRDAKDYYRDYDDNSGKLSIKD